VPWNRRALLAVVLLLAACVPAARAETPASLVPLRFLLGDWEAIPDSSGATGGFTFSPGVQEHVIVRTNYSISPAADGKPSSRHDDLMVIYEDAGTVRADYFDNEGHVIRYVVQPKAGSVAFVSEAKPAEPRYRLTYDVGADGILNGRFEVAPPGKPDAFTQYLAWKARKRR
jgi:hypothetical protein